MDLGAEAHSQQLVVAPLETTIPTRNGEQIALSSPTMSKVMVRTSTMISTEEGTLTDERCLDREVVADKTLTRHTITDGNSKEHLTSSGAKHLAKKVAEQIKKSSESKSLTSSTSFSTSRGRLRSLE